MTAKRTEGFGPSGLAGSLTALGTESFWHYVPCLRSDREGSWSDRQTCVSVIITPFIAIVVTAVRVPIELQSDRPVRRDVKSNATATFFSVGYK